MLRDMARLTILLAAAVGLALAGCGERRPRTQEERLAYGRELLEEMSGRLAAARTISFSTTEESELVLRDGVNRTEKIAREVKLRRPDRLWFRVTGDRDLEGFYEGDRFTLLAHREKVFGTMPMPQTVDGTVKELSERYRIPLPIGGLLTASPHEALLDEATIGGWSGRENVDGGLCTLLAWHHPNVDWSIWIPVEGEPLPKKLQITYKARRGEPTTTVWFERWNLAAPVSDATFARRIPDGYKAAAVAKRALTLQSPDGP